MSNNNDDQQQQQQQQRQHYDGFATMYMRMPMSTSSLTIQGHCSVDDRRVTLRFAFTGIEFDLPSAPGSTTTAAADDEDSAGARGGGGGGGGGGGYEFVIRSRKGRDMTVTVSRLDELGGAYVGYGREDGDEHAVLTFVFYAPDSPLSRLPTI